MSSILYKSTLKPRQVIEPYKYFAEGNEYLYEQDGRITHFDERIRLIYYTGNIINPYQKETTKEVDFEEIFKKTLIRDCEDTEKDIKTLKRLSDHHPIIIGGCGRSGTTLLLSVLASHSKIFGIDTELYSFYPVFRPKKIINFLSDNKFPSNKIWCEKTPKNIINFNKIYSKLNKNVRLIHIVRDGRDVVTSEHPYHPNQYWVSKERWASDVTAGLECENCLLIKYEDLVTKTKETLKTVCDYCSLEFEPKMLDFQKFSNVRENVAWKYGKPVKIHPNRVQKWKKKQYTDIINSFNEDAECVNLLKKLKYE